MKKELRIKPLNKQQIIISLDRLTRFKPTEEKYLRVFKEIITSNLIYPKFKKKELDTIDYEILTDFAQNIINFSLKSFGKEIENDFYINKKLWTYEKSVFKFDKNVEKLLDNKIDYKTAMTFIEGKIADPHSVEHPVLNLNWLKSLSEDENQIQNRINLGTKFPIEKIVIVEGITEEILLPKFAFTCGLDFNKAGIHIISAGGKNPVVKLFYKFADILKLPIFVLLDNDAKENYQEILPKLRKKDKVHVLASGEFEDTLPLPLIKRSLNKVFNDCSKVVLDDLRQNLPMTQILENIFKQRGLEFKKAEFAILAAENILSEKDISLEIKSVVKELSDLC